MDDEGRVQSLDAQIAKISKSTRTTVPAVLPLHDVLRQKYPWYYRWHLKSFSNLIHFGVLFIYIITLGLFVSNQFAAPRPVFAASTKTWDSKADWQAWKLDGTSADVKEGSLTLAPAVIGDAPRWGASPKVAGLKIAQEEPTPTPTETEQGTVPEGGQSPTASPEISPEASPTESPLPEASPGDSPSPELSPTPSESPSSLPVYQTVGKATLTFRPSPHKKNDWLSGKIQAKKNGQNVIIKYSIDNKKFVPDIATLADSETLYVEIDLETKNNQVTPEVNSLSIKYRPQLETNMHVISEGIPTDELQTAINVEDDKLVGSDKFKAKLSSNETYFEFQDNEENQYWIKSNFKQASKKSASLVQREKLKWDEVAQGVDLEQKLYENKIKEYLILKNAQALKKFDFDLSMAKGLEVKQDGERIVFTKSDNPEELVEIAAPTAKDKDGNNYTFRYTLQGSKLILEAVDDISGANFPLIIDPSYTIVTGATVNSTSSNAQRKLARDSSNNLYATYYRTATVLNIFMAKSTDNGQTWTEEAVTSETTYAQDFPSIAIDSNNYIHITWRGKHSGSTSYTQIRYIKYTTSWQAIENLTSESYNQSNPSIAIDSNNYIHITWQGYHSGSTSYTQIRYIKYTTSWQAIENLTSDASYAQMDPSIAIDSNNYIHITWRGLHSESTTLYQIRYIKYTTSWQAIENLTSETGTNYIYTPSIAIDSNNYIHIVWFGRHSGSTSYTQIRYIKYTTSWQAIENLTSESYNQSRPSIAIDSNNYLHVVWYGPYSGSTTYYQIRYIKYTTSWQSIQNLTSSASAYQQFPNLIWANHPTISGVKTNRTKNGYAFVWTDDTTVMYYASSDLAWDAPGPATRYWINNTSGNWNDTANWSAESGGTGGASVPVAGDTAIFDNAGGTHNGALTIDTAVNVATLTFDTNYTGTITQGANTITTTTAMNMTGQSLTLGADLTASGTLTIASGKTLDLNGKNITVTGAFTNSGTLKMTGGETTVSLTNDTDSGTVEYTGVAGPYTIQNWTYFNLKINGAEATFNQQAAANVVNGTFNLAAGTYIQPADQDLTVKDDFTIASSGATFTKGSGTAKLKFLGDVTFTGPATAQNLGVVEIGASPDTTELAADYASDSLTINAGDIFNTNGYEVDIGSGGITLATGAPGGTLDTTDDVETDGCTITDAGNFTINAGGVFTKDVTGTRSLVKMDGGITQTLTSSSQDLGDFQTSIASTHVDLVDALNVDSLTIDGSTTLDNSGGNYAINVAGNWTNAGTFTSGTNTVTFDGAADQIITTNSNAFNNLILNNTAASGNDDIIISGALDVNGLLTITDGDLDIGTNNPNVNTAGDVSIASAGAVTKGTGTWTFDGTTIATYTDSSTGGPQNIGKVTVNKTGLIPVSNNVLILGSSMKVDTMTVDNTAGTYDYLYLGASGYTLELANTPSDNTTVLTVTSPAVLSPGTSTVKYTATNSAGNVNVTTTTYNSLQFTPASAETYDMTGSLTTTNAMTGSLTIDANATLDVRPSTTDYSITCVNVTINTGGILDATSAASTFTASGNWDHSAGQYKTGSSTVVLSGSGTIKITGWGTNQRFYNLTLNSGITTTALSTLQINGTLTVNSSATLTDGASSYDVWLYKVTATILANSGDITGMNAVYYRGDSTAFSNAPVAATTYPILYVRAATNSASYQAQGAIIASALWVDNTTATKTTTFDTNGQTITINGAVNLGGFGGDSGSGAITAGASAINVAGNFTINTDGTFTAGTSTVTFNAGAGTQTLNSGGVAAANTFNNIVHSGAGSLQLTANSLNVDGNFTNSAGTFDMGTNGLDMTVAGNYDSTGGNLTQGTRTITLDGSGAQSFKAGGTGAGHTPYNITSTNASASGVTFADSLTLAAGGTLADNTANSKLTFTDARTYTIPNLDIDGAAAQLITLRASTGADVWHLNVTNAPTLTYVDAKDSNAAGGALITANTSNDSGNNTNWDFGGVTYISGTVYTAEDKSTNVGAGISVALSVNGGVKNTTTTTAGGVFAFNSVGVAANNTLTFFTDDVTHKSNLVTQVLNTTNDITGLEMYTGDIALRHETAGPMTNTLLDTADNLADPNMFFSVATGNATFTKKLWLESGFNYTPGGSVTVNDVVEIRATATMNLGTSSYTLSVGGTTANPLTVGGTLTTGTSTVKYTTVNAGGNVNITTLPYSSLQLAGAETYGLLFDQTGDNALSGDLTIDNGATLDAVAFNITLAGNWTNSGTFVAQNKTVTFNGTTAISGSSTNSFNNVSITGALTAPAANMNVAGNWSKAGTFTANGGTITLNGAGASTQAITGSTTFNNLTAQAAAARTLQFAASSTTAVATLDFDGAAGQLLSLRSSSAGTAWNLNVTNAPTLTYVDAKDSNAAGGALITANTSNDSGNNTNWDFGGVTYISGTVYTAEDKSTNIGAGKTIGLSVNGGAQNSATTIAGGVFSFNSVGVAANNTLTFFVDGDTVKANLVTQVLNTTNDITGLELYSGDVSLRHETAGPMTNTLLDTADNLADADMFFSVATGDATFTKKLWVESGFNYTPGGQVIDSDSLEVRGTATFAPAANAVSVSGNWTMSATGTFTTSGTVTFNAGSGGKTITSATKSFANLVFDGVGGGWTLQDTLATTGNFTVTNGAPNIQDYQVTVNGNLDISGGQFAQNDSGTNYLILAGTGKTAKSTLDTYNPRRLKVTGTYTSAGNLKFGKAYDSTYGRLVIDGGTLTMNDVLYGFLDTTDSMSIINGGDIAGNGEWYFYIDTDTTLPGFTATAGNGLYFFSNNGFTDTYTLGGNLNVVNKWLLNYFDSELSAGSASITAANLYIGSGTSGFHVDLGSGTHSISGNLSRAAGATSTTNTLNLNTTNISVGGNVDFTGITVTAGTGTMTLNGGGAQSITSAAQTPYNITSTNASASGVTFADSLTLAAGGTLADNTANSKLTFTAGSTYTIPTLDIDGAAAQLVTLRSTSAGTAWNLNVTNAPTLTYVDAKDSNAAGGALITANNSNDSGNNTNWSFGGGVTYISGTVYTAEDKSTNVGAGISVALSVNGGAKNTTTTTAGGVFAFNSVGVAADNTLTFFTDDVTYKSNLVTQVLNTTNDITGLEMYTGDIALRHETAGPMTNTLLDTADNLADPNMFFSVATGNATFTKKLWLESGFNYTPGGQVIDSDSLEVRGTATFAPQANAVSVSGNWTMSATGTFTTSGTVTFNAGAGTQVLISGGKSFSGLTHSGAGTLQLATNDLDINGDFTNSAGTFDANNLNMTIGASWSNTATFSPKVGGGATTQTVTFNAGSSGKTLAGTMTGTSAFYNLTFDNGSGGWIANNNITVTNVLNINAGTFDASSRTITLSGATGTPFVKTGTLTPSSSTFIYSGNYGSGNTTVVGTTYNNLQVNNSSETYVAGGTIIANGDLTVTAGTLSGTNDITVNGGDATGNGTINLTGGTFLLDGTGYFGGSTAWTFYNLTFGDGSGTTTTTGSGNAQNVTISSIFTIATNQTLTDYYKTWILTGSGTPHIPDGTVYMYGSLGSTIRYTGTSATNVYFKGGGTTSPKVELKPTTTVTYTLGTAAGQTMSPANFTVGNGTNVLTLDASTWNTTLNVQRYFTIAANAIFTAGSQTITVGSWSGYGATISGTFNCGTSTFRYIGGASGGINIPATTYYNLILEHGGNGNITFYLGTAASQTINVNGYFYINGDASAANPFTVTAATYNPILNVSGNFSINTGAEIVTFTASSSAAFNVGGNWTNSETFTHNNGTVTLNGAGASTQVITGSTTFNNLTATAAAARTLQFAASSTTAVTTLTMNGSAGQLISLRSSSAGTAWNLNVTNAPTLTYVDAKDSNAAGGALITANTSNDSGNNTNWDFGGGVTYISGTVYTAEDKSTNIGAGKTIGLSVNGGAQNSATTIAGGVFSFNSVGVAANNTLTFFVDGDTVKANLVTQVLNTTNDITGLELYSGDVSLRHETAGPMTNTLLDTADNLADADMFFSVATGNATFTKKLWLESGFNYTPGGQVIDSDALEVRGTATFAPQANAVSVSGNWTMSATGTFTTSGTVTFNAGAGTQVLISGGKSFSGLTHSGAGTLQLATNDLDINGDFTNSAGTFDAATNNKNMNFAGAWSNTGTATFSRGSGTLTFDGTSTVTNSSSAAASLDAVAISGTATLGSNLTMTSNSGAGTLNLGAGSYTLTLTGTGTPLAVTTFQKGTGSTVLYTGTTTATNVAGVEYHHLTFTPTAATTYTLAGAITLSGDLTINTNATLDTKSGFNYAINIAGSWTNNATFTARSGTVTFNGTAPGKTIKTNNSAFSTLTINGSGGEWTLNTNSLGVDNTLTITAGTLNTNNLSLFVTGLTTLDGGTLTGGNAEGMDFYGGLTISSASSVLTASASVNICGTYTKSAGTAYWTTNSSNLYLWPTGDYTLPVDTYYHLGVLQDITNGIARIITLGTGTTTVNGNLNIGPYNTPLYNDITLAVGAQTLTVLGNVSLLTGSGYKGILTATSGTINVGGNWSNAGTFTAGTGTVTFNGTTAISGSSTNSFNNVSITGALTAPAANMNVAGNWSKAGTFTANGGTITLNGAGATTQALTGSTTFNNLTAQAAAARTLQFAASSTTAVATLDFDGSAGQLITLTTSSAPTQWTINPTAASVSYVDVNYSNNTGVIFCAAYSQSTNDTNTNWNLNSGSSCAPTNDSLSFTNPYGGAGNTAVADDTTEWNFRAQVTDESGNGPTHINYVEMRFANSADNTLPYDSLKYRWTESTDTFSEQADTQDAGTITSTGADSNAAGNQWTLDFKIKFNNNFLAKDTQYNIELYTLDDASASDNDDYAIIYQVTATSISLDVDSGTVAFGNLTPGTPLTDTTVATVTTNYPNGYALAAKDDVAGLDSALLHTDTVTRIADYAGTIDIPTLWIDTGLGICVYQATGKEAKWGTGTTETDSNNKYAGIPQNTTTIHSKTGSPTSGDQTYVGYKLDVANTQKTGSYSGTVTYTATGVLN